MFNEIKIDKYILTEKHTSEKDCPTEGSEQILMNSRNSARTQRKLS